MFLTAEFTDADSVVRAITALRAHGFTADQIDVFSTEPVELPHGVLDRPSHMSRATLKTEYDKLHKTVLAIVRKDAVCGG